MTVATYRAEVEAAASAFQAAQAGLLAASLAVLAAARCPDAPEAFVEALQGLSAATKRVAEAGLALTDIHARGVALDALGEMAGGKKSSGVS